MKLICVILLAIAGVHCAPWAGNLQDFHQRAESCHHPEGDFKFKKHDFPKFPHTPPEEEHNPFLPPSTFQSFDGQSEFHDKKFIPSSGTTFGIPHIPPPFGFPYGPPAGHPFGSPSGFPRVPPPNLPHGPPIGFPFGHPPVGPPPLFPKIPSYPPPKVPGYPKEPAPEPKQPTEPRQPTVPVTEPVTAAQNPVDEPREDNGTTNEPGISVNSGTEIVPNQNGDAGLEGDGAGRTDSGNEASSAKVTDVPQENSNSNIGFNSGLGDPSQQQPGSTNNGQVDRQLSESEIQDIINPRLGMKQNPTSKVVRKTN